MDTHAGNRYMCLCLRFDIYFAILKAICICRPAIIIINFKHQRFTIPTALLVITEEDLDWQPGVTADLETVW